MALFSCSSFAQVVTKYNEDTAFQKTLTLSAPSTRAYALAQFGKMYKLDKNYTFQTIRTTTDVAGMSHERIQQYYKGVKVEYGTVILHSKEGSVVSINGELYNASNLNLTPALSPKSGMQYALNSVNAQKYLWEDKEQAAEMNYKMPQGDLVVFPKILSGEIRLAYKYDIYALQPIAREEVYVDANTGEILFKNAIIKHADRLISPKRAEALSKNIEMLAAGTAATRYSGSRTIETTFDSGLNKYVLNDFSRGNGILTYNSAGTNTRPSTNFVNTTNTWNTGNYATASSTKDNAALDAHWGAEMTFDFWKNVFNRNSFDDANAQIKSYVHYDDVPGGAGYSNAFWNGSSMTYGDGSTKPFTALDVCGHEIGHAICTYTADLVYAQHSGAMNEGYSDIWGACIEHYGRTGSMSGTPVANVWLVGEDIVTGGLRSMANPNAMGDPDCVKGTGWVTTSSEGTCTPAQANDQCGVHTNSGVLNHWFYILAVGESGTNNAPVAERDTYAVTGIGIQKAAQIAYFAERDYLTSNATYTDARNATIAVASTLYCASSPEVIAVTNAWMAVNVGAAYVGQTNDVALKTISGTSAVSCGAAYSASIVFENAGSASISSVTVSYNIDGGANTVSTWTGTLPNCSSINYPIAIGTLTRGTHLLSVTTTIASDGNAANNTKTVLLTVNTNGTVGVTNTFNAASDALVTVDDSGKTSTLWERGTLSKTLLTNAVAGSQVYATKLTGNYPDNSTSYLVSQCYDLTNIGSPTVSFDMAFDLESNWDIIYMEYSTNGGSSWSVLGTSADANWYNSSRLPDGTDCFNCIGSQWTGDYATAPTGGNGMNGNKRNYSHTLSQFGNGGATPASNIMFRFKFISDEGTNQQGVMIDNFVVQGTLATAQNNFETFNVWPNPSTGAVNIQLNTTEKVNVTLFDIRGRNVFNKVYNSTGSMFNQEVNFNSLEKGIYLLNVESEGKKATKKLIIN